MAATAISWGDAITGSLATSTIPVLALVLLPPNASNPKFLRLLLAFAAGAILGDVCLHMIPSMVEAQHMAASDFGHHDEHHHHHDHHHEHDHGHDHHDHDHHHEEHQHASPHAHVHHGPLGDQMMLVIVGLAAFFAIDGLLRCYGSHGNSSHDHGHGHNLDEADSPSDKVTKKDDDHMLKKLKKGAVPKKVEPMFAQKFALLPLLADFLHNFSDGLAIGASFLTSPATGYRTTILILTHEFPHELGDFAFLKSCGWGMPKIIGAQLVTGIGNLLGVLTVLTIGASLENAQFYITPLAAGSFLYIALTSMLGELNAISVTFNEKVLQLLAMFTGIAALHQVCWLEESLGVHTH